MIGRLNRPGLFFIILSAILFFACTKPSADDRSLQEQRSFCYWETNYKTDTTLLRETGMNHFYIRYFDVDWDSSSGEAKPIASLSTNDSLPVSFTPAVFFTNKVFEKSSEKDLDSLSFRTAKRIIEITGNFGYRAFCDREGGDQYVENRDSLIQLVVDECQSRYSEVLIDCDWTQGTRDKFFYFIKRLKKDLPDKNITVTLRLWQYKRNQREDIPPVDRGLLMCYNMQALNDSKVQNSIASLEELKKYVSGTKYPLPLDVALPVFSWSILFRNDKFIGILGNTDNKAFANNMIEYKDMGNGRYLSLTDKIIGDYFIRKGDLVRVEAVSKEELEQMAGYLKSEVPMDQYSRITFFSWNKLYINNYGTDEIKKIYSTFNR